VFLGAVVGCFFGESVLYVKGIAMRKKLTCRHGRPRTYDLDTRTTERARNMRSWRLAMACMVFLAVAIYLVLWLTSQPADSITRENFARIKFGMTKEEVVKLLGPPRQSFSGRMPPGPNWGESAEWRGRLGSIKLRFSGDDPFSEVPYILTEMDFRDEDNTTFFDTLRRWLGISP
jgi:hypothetical protein